MSTEMSHRAGNARSVLDFLREEFCNELEPALMYLADTSFEFAELMRRAFPVFRIQPIQSIDHGLVRPRAQLTFDPSAVLQGRGLAGQADQRIDFTLDLFRPPVHFLHLQDCVEEKQSNPDHSLKRIAATLGIGHMTVKRAFDVARRMEAEGLSEPYRVLTAALATASRWKVGA